MSDIHTMLADIDQLPTTEKWQILKHVLRTLEQEQKTPSPTKSDWSELLRATYGILADDPIEHPQQLPLEEREPPK